MRKVTMKGGYRTGLGGNTRIDLAAFAKTIDVKRVLNDLGLPFKERLGGTEIMLKCINPDHPDRSADSLHMNARGDAWNGCFQCNPCGLKGSFFKFLTLACNEPFGAIISFLKSYGQPAYIGSADLVLKDRAAALQEPKGEAAQVLPEMRVDYTRFGMRQWDGSPHERYMSSRMIMPAVAFSAGVGYNERFEYKPGVFAERSIVFPIFFGGKLVSYFLRCWDGDFWPGTRRLFPKGAPVSSCLYGIDDCVPGDPTVVVEGIIDCLVVRSALMANGLNRHNVVAAYSNNASKQHVAQLVELGSELIVMPDRDGKVEGGFDPGWLLCESIAKFTSHRSPTSVAVLPKGQDPGDSSYSDIIKAITDAEPWTEMITRNKLFYGKPYVS